MHVVGSVFSIVFAICLAFFALLNRQDVPVTWLPFGDQATMPLYLICAISAVFGFTFGSLLTWLYGAKSRKVKREQKKHIKDLEKKLGKIQHNASNDHLNTKAPGLMALGK